MAKAKVNTSLGWGGSGGAGGDGGVRPGYGWTLELDVGGGGGGGRVVACKVHAGTGMGAKKATQRRSHSHVAVERKT